MNIDLTTKLEEKNLALAGLELSNKSARLVSDKFNKEINENREAFQLEKTAIIKDFKAQIKIWRKDLGEERREKICIEKKLDNLKKKTEEKRVKT